MSMSQNNIHGFPINVGDEVMVRAQVSSVSGSGITALVTLTVDTTGHLGEKSNVSFSVGPKQIR